MLLAVVAGFKSHHAKHKRISATRTISPFRVHSNSRPSNPSSMKAIHNKMEQPHTLVLIRLLYMIYSMAIGCVQPFLSVYYRSLGHGGEIIGLIMSISPFTSFLVGPIWGLITDKVQQPFLILYITTMMSMIGQLLVYQMDEPRHIMVMVCITSLFSTPVKPLIDSLVMMRLSDRSQFGKLRLFSILGTGIATSIAGSFLKMEDHIDYFPIHEGDSMRDSLTRFWQSLVGYKLLFFAYTVLHIPTFFCIRLFQKAHEAKGTPTKETEKKKEQPPIRMKDVVAIVLQDKKVIFFFSLVYIMGISSGMGENFVYIRFQEVGGTGANMGMSRLLSSIGGAAMFWHSGKISSALGMERVMALSLAIVATRFTLLYFMKNIYFGYLAEFFRGMTFGCFWSSSIVYASQLAPPELQVTMLQFLSGVYNGIGRSTGAIVGGKLQSEVGTASTFMYGAITNALFASLLILYCTVYERTKMRSSKKDN